MINKIMKKYGYELIKENEHGVYYERNEPQGFTHVVCVVPKSNGNHIMQSYDKELHDIGKTFKINEMCGVEIPILLLMWLKAKYLIFKYHWNNK